MPLAAVLGLLGVFLGVQTTRVRFVFDDEALEVFVGGGGVRVCIHMTNTLVYHMTNTLLQPRRSTDHLIQYPHHTTPS